MSLNILFISSYYLPRFGGIPNYTHELSKQYLLNGHKVSVITSNIGSNVKTEVIEGVRITRVPSLSLLSSPLMLRLPTINERPDLVHLHYPHPFYLDYGFWYAKHNDIPVVISSHGKEVEGKIAYLYNSIFYDYYLKNSDGVISATKMAITQSKLLSRHSRKINIIPHGVNYGKFSAKVDKSTNDSEKIILYVGAFRKYKGLSFLIKSLSILSKKGINYKCILVGDGELKRELVDYSISLNVSENIHFVNFVSEKDLLSYYSLCDVFVLPSPSIAESFGLVVLEACAAGKPVIVTHGSGVSELLMKEQVGLICDPYNSEDLAEKIISVIGDEQYARLLGKTGKLLAQKYTWKRCANETLKLYYQIINNDL